MTLGVGYLLLDPETGSGAYKISGGANGSLMLLAALGAIAIGLIFLSGGIAALAPIVIGGTIAASDAYLLVIAGVLLGMFGTLTSIALTKTGAATWSEILPMVCYVYGTVVSGAIPILLGLGNLISVMTGIIVFLAAEIFNFIPCLVTL
jgi:hypothetical protein